MTTRILCVCLGNICRSPLAMLVIQDEFAKAGIDACVESVGTSNYHVGEAMDPRAAATAAAAGYDPNHHARQLTAQQIAEADLVLVMDQQNLADVSQLARQAGLPEDHIQLIRDYDPGADSGAEVPDPYYNDRFSEVLDMLRATAPHVVSAVTKA